MLTVGSLFSGIGGFDLGLERAGMRVIWQSEIDPYASAVLRKHWPAVPNLGDIRGIERYWGVAADAQREHGGTWGARGSSSVRPWESEPIRPLPDVLCGGFPCQDISNAGKRSGIDGDRSGLWAEFARVIGELRPRYVIVENVAALLGRGIERVLGDLATLGFDAEWHCIPASAVGAPHRRDRVWIVAYAERERGCLWDPTRKDASDAWESSRRAGSEWWLIEPDVGRVAHGIPRRVDRLRCLGNAIVPQIAEIIGRAIIASEGMTP